MLTSGAKAANRVSRGRVPAKTFCFVAGTLVVTAIGPVPIEAIAVGDHVLSRDSATGEQDWRPVTELFRNQTRELMHVDIGTETITATPEHPFWVEGAGWVEAGRLAAGDKVARAEGDPATIVSVTRERLESPQDVYNFEVAEFHTYFVASAGVWVHNACGKPNSGVYEFVVDDKVYVGQSKDITKRLATHARTYGKEAVSRAKRYSVTGNKTQREIFEQGLLDKRIREGNKVLNVRNPIGKKRVHLMGKGYRRP